MKILYGYIAFLALWLLAAILLASCATDTKVQVRRGWATLTKIEFRSHYSDADKYFLTWRHDDGSEVVEWANDTIGVRLFQRIACLH